jgi:glycosyltransferase involved in cell wall biosynthesis
VKYAFFVHYFPPLNSTGAKRVEAFAKYLSRAGHEIVVVSTRKTTVDGPLSEPVPAYLRLYELDLLGRHRPTSAPQGGAGSAGAARPEAATTSIHWSRRLKQRMARSLGQLPDPRIPFALALASPWLDRRLSEDLRTADVFVSSFPPWPAHLAAAIAKRRWRKPWVIDFRDQFSGNHIMSGGPMAERLETRVDRWLVSRANAVTTISEPMQRYYSQFHDTVVCVENGYDGELLEAARGRIRKLSATGTTRIPPLVIRYMGTITRDRIPMRLFEALARDPARMAQAVTFEFYGDSRLLQAAVDRDYRVLKPLLRFLPAVSYPEAIEKTLTADALLFVETSDRSNLSAQGVLTTKLFEYIAAGRPIIAEIAPESLAAQYILRASPHHVVSREPEVLLEGLSRIASAPPPAVDGEFVRSLSREAKTSQFESLCARVVATQGRG